MPSRYPQSAPHIALEGTCPECQKKFDIIGQKMFCTQDHAAAYNNRQLARGQAMVTLAMAWRGARSSKDQSLKMAGKDAFSAMASLADHYNTQDREAGRMPAAEVLVRRRARGLIT